MGSSGEPACKNPKIPRNSSGVPPGFFIAPAKTGTIHGFREGGTLFHKTVEAMGGIGGYEYAPGTQAIEDIQLG